MTMTMMMKITHSLEFIPVIVLVADNHRLQLHRLKQVLTTTHRDAHTIMQISSEVIFIIFNFITKLKEAELNMQCTEYAI